MTEEFRISKKITNGDFYLIALIIAGALFLLIGAIFQYISLAYFEVRTPGFITSLMELLDEGKYLSFTDDMWFTLVMPVFMRNFILLILFGVFLRKVLLRDLKKFKEDFWHNIAGIIIGMMFILVLTVIITNVYKLLGIEGNSENQEQIVSGFQSKHAYLLYFGVLLAPFVEEVIFRQFIFGVVEEKFKWPWWVSVIASAIIFAAIHDTGIFFFQYLLTSLVLCLSYAYFKKNIWVPIGIHFLNNALPLLLLAFGIII